VGFARALNQMGATLTYNLSPLPSLLLVGALLAFGPVTYAWFRGGWQTPSQRVHGLRVLTLFLTFDLLLFGAFTRLSDSGLGCPDWPGCYGHTSPIGAAASITEAQIAMPNGPVTHAKAWIEMLHRYLATAVGALIVLLTMLSWHDWLRRGGRKPWLPTLTLVWVCLQGAFGALTVTMRLFPAIVTLHLLGALVLLALLCVQVGRGEGSRRTPQLLPTSVSRLLVLSSGLLLLQVTLGAWVSSNYAVLACSDFPTCQGSWWPEMNFSQGFDVRRGLGENAVGVSIDFAALTAIHYVHRLVAYGVVLLLMLLAWQLNRIHAWRLQSRVLAGLIILQLATGLSNVVLGWPMLAALLHTGGAGALVLSLTWVAALVQWRTESPALAARGQVSPGVGA
jgi:cytochrome c oxidase assembly protein subunit 15